MNNVIFNSKNGARDDVIKIAIVMTDGETNPGGYDDELPLEVAMEWTQNEAKVAKDNGVYIFAIGVGSRVNDEVSGVFFLYNIAYSLNFSALLVPYRRSRKGL
jgi:hypothetical protein